MNIGGQRFLIFCQPLPRTLRLLRAWVGSWKLAVFSPKEQSWCTPMRHRASDSLRGLRFLCGCGCTGRWHTASLAALGWEAKRLWSGTPGHCQLGVLELAMASVSPTGGHGRGLLICCKLVATLNCNFCVISCCYMITLNPACCWKFGNCTVVSARFQSCYGSAAVLWVTCNNPDVILHILVRANYNSCTLFLFSLSCSLCHVL